MSEQTQLFDQEAAKDDFDAAIELTKNNPPRPAETPQLIDVGSAAERAKALLEAPRQPEQLTAETKTPNYAARRTVAAVAGLALAGGAGAGIADTVEKHNTHETVAETTITIPEGGTVIGESQAAVASLLEEQGLDQNSIRNDQIVYEGQEAAQEAGSGVTMSGDQFEVELKVNGYGAHSVDITPVDGQTSPTDLPSDLG